MFNDFSVVTTAISSFNNAALLGSYFFAMGLMSIPLFYIIYIYGRDILARLGWTNNIGMKISFWSVFGLTFWLLIFGGNYAVMRDSISLLPALIALVLFVSMIYITKRSKELNYLTIFKDRKIKWLTFLTLLILTVFSAKPDLWGILLQLSAVLCGIIVGSRLHKKISDLPISTLIFGTTTALILMQPEFFRFGQLGNLTFIHLAALLITGFFAVTALTVKYTNTRGKIRESAYIKLKWLFRIVATLALILFDLTESVPVFAGLLSVIGISEMLTIYHMPKMPEYVSKQSWAMMLICFGILIICPIISCLGILYLTTLSAKTKSKDFTDLL